MTADNAMDPEAPPVVPEFNPGQDGFVFDLETTGVDVDTVTPCQICLVLARGDERRILMNTLVRPHGPIDPEAAAVHGITDEKAMYGPDYALVAWQVGLMCEQIKPAFLVGFNSITFDKPILDRCYGGDVFAGTRHLDVLNVAYRYFPTLEGHKLGQLYETFMGRPLTGAHDASVDVMATLDILDAMREQIGLSMKDLAEAMSYPRVYDYMPIGKHKGLDPKNVPIGWARWMRKHATDMRPDLQATVDYIAGGCRDLPW